MKPLFLLSVVVSLACFSSCENFNNINKETPADQEDPDKRFSNDNAHKLTSAGAQNSGLVDWNNAFNKRFPSRGSHGFTSNSDNDDTLIDWSRMFKRFQSGKGNSKFGKEDEKFVNWNSAFAKRFSKPQGNALDTADNMMDWSSVYNKRFGTMPDNPNLIDWSAMYEKKKRPKRSARGFKRFRSGSMSFAPNAFQEDDFVDWSNVFAKRGFNNDAAYGGLGYDLPDWRNQIVRRNFGGSNKAYFGHDGLEDYGLQKWDSILDRKRRMVDEHEAEQ